VLFIWLDGGLSQLESWDPKPNSQFGGPFRTIPTAVPGIHICELLPKVAKQMDKLVLVRSMATKDNAHSSGVARVQRGDPKPRGVDYPFFGSAVAKLLGPGNSGLPPYVVVKPGNGGFIHGDAGFLGPRFGALALGDGKAPENLLLNPGVSNQDDAERRALRALADRRYAEGRRPDAADANLSVFDLADTLMKRGDLFDESKISAKDIERYGATEFGRHLLIGRRMIEAGITFVKVTSYGWDSHGDNFNANRNTVPKVDRAFAALLEDLSASGMLDNVLVILMSEFGRTPRINGHIGRDHWPEAWSLAMAGTGLKRGVAVGKTNDKGTFVTSEEQDIGAMFHTWFRCLGIDSKRTEYDNNGQPLPIAHDNMKPLMEALA